MIPGAELPAQFGLTETVGSLPAGRAAAFVATGSGTGWPPAPTRTSAPRSTALQQVHTARTDLSVWRVTHRDQRPVVGVFLMGIARRGTAVAQVGFVPGGEVTMGPDAFVALVAPRPRAPVRDAAPEAAPS